MGNLLKLFQHKVIRTENLSLSADINTAGKRSFYSIPLLSSFGGHDFPISLIIPTDEIKYAMTNAVDLNEYFSFFWSLNRKDTKYILKRPGLPECIFVKTNGIYYCDDTGECLLEEPNYIFKYVDENMTSYYFNCTFPSAFVERIVFSDGFELNIKVVQNDLKLSSPNLSGSDSTYPSPYWTFYASTTSANLININASINQYGKSYKVLSSKTTLVSGGLNIDIESMYNFTYMTTHSYQFRVNKNGGTSSLSLIKNNVVIEKITTTQSNSTLQAYAYMGNNLIDSIKIEKTTFYAKVTDTHLSGYQPSQMFSLNNTDYEEDNIKSFHITSFYGNDGYASTHMCDSKGRIVETCDSVPYTKCESSVLNGFFDDSLNSWTLSSDSVVRVTESIFPYHNILNNYAVKIPANCSISQTISTKLLSRQSGLLYFFANATVRSNVKLKVRIETTNPDEYEGREYNAQSITSDVYTFLSLGITAKKYCNSIKISFTNVGTTDLFIKAIQFLKNFCSTKIAYDDVTGLVKGLSKGNSITKTKQDIYNRTLYTYGANESGINKYMDNNTNHILVETTDALQRKKKYTYKHYPELTNKNCNYKMVEKVFETYNSDNTLLKISNSFDYNKYSWNISTITDDIGRVIKYNYDICGNLYSIYYTADNIHFSYNEEGKIRDYSFYDNDYDYSWYANQITYVNSITTQTYSEFSESTETDDYYYKNCIINYEYDSHCRLIKALTANNYLLTEVKYKNENTNQIEYIKNGDKATTATYDSYERISTVTLENVYNFAYTYDTLYSLNKIVDSISKLESESKASIDNSSVERILKLSGTNISSLQYINDFITGSTFAKVKDGNKKEILSTSNALQLYNGGVKTLLRDLMEQGFYTLILDDQNHDLILDDSDISDKKSIRGLGNALFRTTDYIQGVYGCFSYNITSTAGYTIAFMFYGKNCSVKIGNDITITLISSKLHLNFKGNIVTSNYTCNSNGWNSVVLSFVLNNEGYLYFNDEAFTFPGATIDNSINVQFEGDNANYSCIAIKQQKIEQEYCQEISSHYRSLCLPKLYYCQNNSYTAQEHTSIYDTNGYDIFIPLDNSFATSSMAQPKVLNIQDNFFKLSKRQLFMHVPSENKRMFIADGTTLSYQLPLRIKNAVFLKILPFKNNCTERCILTIGPLSLKLVANGILAEVPNKGTHLLETEISTERVTKIALGVELLSRAVRNSTLNVTLSVNGIIETFTISIDQLRYLGDITIGSQSDSSNPFYGLIGEVAITPALIVKQILAQERNNNPIEWTKNYDLLSRPTLVEAYNKDKNLVLTMEYVYKANGCNQTNTISKEKIYVGNILYKNDNIAFDEHNRLTQYGNRTFTYDTQGHLIGDSLNKTNIFYDYFGNITRRKTQDNDFIYSYTSDKRLTKIVSNLGTTQITYSSTSPMFPTKISTTKNNIQKNVSFEYVGKVLNSTTIDEDKYSYTYNSDGLRTLKTMPNGKKEYYQYAENGLLRVLQTNKGYSLMYSYSPSGVPLMVTYQTKSSYEKYLYIVDFTGTIIAITDENGNIVAEYEYDIFGLPTVTKDNTNIGITNIDPLKYKGYIYDSETELYYCSSRYYSPETGRFIQPDNYSNLDPSKIDGFNLYAYAKNDTINLGYLSFNNDNAASIIASVIAAKRESNNGIGFSINFDYIVNGISYGESIYSATFALSTLVLNGRYFFKNLITFSDDMKLLGVSTAKGVLAFNKFTWGIGKFDVFSIALGVALDIYDSIKRGVSTEGIVIGAALTAVTGLGLVYLNKGIIYVTTTIGNFFFPGVGAVVGFAVGLIASALVDYFISKWIGDLIDRNVH